MTMFPPAATSTQHHLLHHQNLSNYTENRCYVDTNTTSSYGGYLNNQSIFGTDNHLNYVQGEGYDNFCSTVISGDPASLVGSDYSQVMAEEDESKTETVEISKAVHDHEEEAAGSSSKDLIKDIRVDDEQGSGGWLQLSIGSHTATAGSSNYSQYHRDNENKLLHDGRLIMQTRGDEEHIHRQQFVELDLLPNSSCDEVKSTTNFTQDSVVMNRSPAAAASSSTPQQQQQQQQQQYYYSPVLPPRPTNLFLQHYYPQTSATSSHYPLNPNYHDQQQVGSYQDYNPHWPAFRSSSSASSSSSLMPPLPSYFSRLPFQLPAPAGVDVVAHHLPRFDFRVVDPPRRPHSGIWFTLQASQIQAKEPFLPQIPKSYLRIKDRQMTIRLIIKYLVNKLRLDSEAEIEIRCKGQQLLPFLTLQHVRDSIWNPRDSSSFSSSDHLQHHLMVLHYGRTTAA